MDFGWPKINLKSEDQKLMSNHYIGFCFDHQVEAENSNPRVIELTAEEEVDGVVVFKACEDDIERMQAINDFVNDGIREYKLLN